MGRQATKYATLLCKTQETKDKDALSFKVGKAELTLQGTILATKESLSDAVRNLELVKGTFPFDAKAILEAEDLVSDIEVSIERLEGLKGMF